eukprot:GGOE01053388.1.p1 GENE.GGOE01053388.1~~GGOE01053388.1.p1  ORF type:complete len:433 (-),score=125.36 GGOE01053388.1:444-1583(-)
MAPTLPPELLVAQGAAAPSPILYTATSPAMATLGHPSTWPVLSVPPVTLSSSITPDPPTLSAMSIIPAPHMLASSIPYESYKPEPSQYATITTAEAPTKEELHAQTLEDEERKLHEQLARMREAELLWAHEAELARKRGEAQLGKAEAQLPKSEAEGSKGASQQQLEARCAEADQQIWEQMKRDEKESLERQKRAGREPALDPHWWSVEQELSRLRQQRAEWEFDIIQREEKLREKWEELQVQRSIAGGKKSPFPGLSAHPQSVPRTNMDQPISPASASSGQFPGASEVPGEGQRTSVEERDQQLWEEAKRLEQLTVSREKSRAKQQDEQWWMLEQEQQQLQEKQDVWEAEMRRMEEQVAGEQEALLLGRIAEPGKEYF